MGPSHLLHTLLSLTQQDQGDQKQEEQEEKEEEEEKENEKEEEEEEEDPTFVPFQHNEIEGDMTDDSDDEDDEDSESSEDSSDEDDDETLTSVRNVADSPEEKALEASCPVFEEGNNGGSDRMIQSEDDEKADTGDDEITKTDSPGSKRKIGHQELQEENSSKRQKNVDEIEAEKESGDSFDSVLNNSLETGYTSEVFSDLEESNEIYSDSYIASY